MNVKAILCNKTPIYCHSHSNSHAIYSKIIMNGKRTYRFDEHTCAMLPDTTTQRGRRRLSVGVLAAVALFLIWKIASYPSQCIYQTPKNTGISPMAKEPTQPETIAPSLRLAKVSMLYGQENRLYERALQSHQRHCDRWNCRMHVLREEISAGYWNKPNYLLSLVLQELAKPAEQRTEWLMQVLPSPQSQARTNNYLGG